MIWRRAGADPSDRLFGERMMGVAEAFSRRPDQRAAPSRASADSLCRLPIMQTRDSISFASGLTCACRARVFLARVLWLQGFPDQAVRTAEISIEEAQATGHALSLCYALALAACPIALWVGNLAAAAHYTRMLLDHSRKHGLPLWSAFGSRFQRVVAHQGVAISTHGIATAATPASTRSPSPTSAFGS